MGLHHFFHEFFSFLSLSRRRTFLCAFSDGCCELRLAKQFDTFGQAMDVGYVASFLGVERLYLTHISLPQSAFAGWNTKILDSHSNLNSRLKLAPSKMGNLQNSNSMYLTAVTAPGFHVYHLSEHIVFQ